MRFLALLLSCLALPAAVWARDADGFAPWHHVAQAAQNVAHTEKTNVNEAGVRYWYSIGDINFDVSKDPRVSRLDYDVDSTHSGEAYLRFNNRDESFFIKGLAALGGKLKGHIQDLDYENDGVTTASDTTSNIDTGNLKYAQIDLGFRIPALSNKSRSFTTNIIGGYGYFADEMTAHGITCNQASGPDFGGCAGPGDVLAGGDVKVLKNNATWNAARIGIENTLRPSRHWQLRTELVAIPYADFKDDDSHYLRAGVPTPLDPEHSPLGLNLPNFRNSGTGYGTQLQAVLDINVTRNWTINAGARYWRFWSDETDTLVGNPLVLNRQKAYNWDHQRYGLLLGASYKF